MRIGQGYDAHRFGDEKGTFEIRLGGVDIPSERQILAHSDGDVLVHALCDALLGALALGDIGKHFPDTDEACRDINSLQLLQHVNKLISNERYRIVNMDLTLLAETPRVATYVDAMKEAIGGALGISDTDISIKATTTERMGFIGRGEGVAAMAIVLLTSL
jgi:2-C-methyl-D-erythritol 2,4-cyclodiphosphate synthase